ncbi:MAG TPA: hypothetical protein DIT46_10035 [Gemmatimonadetes bacterium]|nr:hypothetical protein [Gemmatimonadota bacterium]
MPRVPGFSSIGGKTGWAGDAEGEWPFGTSSIQCPTDSRYRLHLLRSFLGTPMSGPVSFEGLIKDTVQQAVRSLIEQELQKPLCELKWKHDPYLTRSDIARERGISLQSLYRQKRYLIPGRPDGKIGRHDVWHKTRCESYGLIGPKKLPDQAIALTRNTKRSEIADSGHQS